MQTSMSTDNENSWKANTFLSHMHNTNILLFFLSSLILYNQVQFHANPVNNLQNNYPVNK